MPQFSQTNQPAKNGRKVGSKNKKSQFSDILTTSALEQLTAAVNNGESWAIQTVIARTHPQLKAITPEASLDGELIQAKITELTVLKQKVEALENEFSK